jgi:serine protease Do
VVGGAKAGGFTIGFAIPINMASVVQQEIIKNGRMHRGTVGLVVEDLPYGEAQATGGAVNYGAVVKQVLSNTSAAQKGLKPGNVIVGAARKPVRSAAEYMTRVSTVPLGEQLPIEVYSNGKRTRIWLTVDATAVEPKKQTIGRDMGSMSGITVADIVPGNALYGDVRGAQIVGMPTIQLTNVTSCFEVGDVIVAIGGVKVTTADDLLLRVEQAGVQYRVDIQRDGVPAWVRASR